MRRLLWLPVLCLLTTLSYAAPEPPAPAAPPALDLTTPEAAVRSFILASNRMEARAATCILGGKIDQDLMDWEQDVRKDPDGRFVLTVVHVETTPEGDAVRAKVTTGIFLGNELRKADDELRLRKEGEKWKIVPPTQEELRSIFEERQTSPHILQLLISTYFYPKVFVQARTAARRANCTSNLKILATAMDIYTVDHDGKLPPRADAWKAAIMPYVKKESNFQCPIGEGGVVSYSFNANLQGLFIFLIEKPDGLVMVYEGKKGILDFRHGGQALVCFADGQVRPVNAEEAKRLRWKP